MKTPTSVVYVVLGNFSFGGNIPNDLDSQAEVYEFLGLSPVLIEAHVWENNLLD